MLPLFCRAGVIDTLFLPHFVPAAGADEAVDELIRRTSANQWATVMIDHDQQALAIIRVRSRE